MKITVEAEPKEIAALVVALQERHLSVDLDAVKLSRQLSDAIRWGD